jgi:hypothetical protein
MMRRGINAIKSLVQPLSVSDLAKEDKQKSRATDWLDKQSSNPNVHKDSFSDLDKPATKPRAKS